MTLPNESSIKLPLLLELERAGGPVRPGPEFYGKVAAHFPDITQADRQMLRSDGLTKVWEHSIAGTRSELRVKGQLNGGQRGIWQITQAGKERLRQELGSLGIPATDEETFISGRETLPQRLGQRWKPKQWTPRPRRGKRPLSKEKPTKQPPIERPVTQGEVAAPDIRARVLERVRALDDQQFERFCGRLLEALECTEVRITGRSGDRGIDGHATLKHLGLPVAFQAKNWRNNQVGGPRVREFRGSIVNRFPAGIYITTSSFTPGAQEEADEPGPPKIVLIEGEKLVDIMLEKGLGVHTVPVTTQEIAEEFFASI